MTSTLGNPSPRSSGLWRLVLAGALAGAALALPACGDSPEPPAEPGGNVDPGATGGVGGVINRTKDVADDVESRDASIDASVESTTTTP